jgi:hypothetical protein
MSPFVWFHNDALPTFYYDYCTHCYNDLRTTKNSLTFGYPAVVALSLDRQAYAVMHGSFSDKVVTAFLHGVTTGRQSTMKLPSSVSMESLIVPVMEPWDGLDAPPIEEEMSLEDIMGWGDDDDTTDDEKKASDEL